MSNINIACKNAAHRINNFAADYIMNHRLVQNGLPQLPIGLFSEDINYEKVKRLSDMWKIIMEEMEAQTPEAQEQQKNQQDDHLNGKDNTNEKQQDDSQGDDPDNNNEPNQDGEQSQDGQGNQDSQDQQNGDQQDSSGDSQGDNQQQDGNQDGNQSGNQQQDQQGQDSQDAQDSSGSQDGQGNQQQGSQSDQDSQDQQDGNSSNQGDDLDTSELDAKEEQMQKEQDDILNNRKKSQDELKKDMETAKEEMDRIKKDDIERKLKDLKQRNGAGREQLDKEYKPKFDWKKLIKNMMPSGDTKKEDSWSKISRRNASGLHQLKKTGIAAAKQGEIEIDDDSKDILFIVDNSGSVYAQVKKINKEIEKLITKHGDGIRNFWVIKFDSQFTAFKVDVETLKVQEYTNGKDMLKPKANIKSAKLPLKTLFTGDSGGTDFSQAITKIAKTVMEDNGNVILFTDSDILWDSNLKNLMFLITKYGKKPFVFNILMATKSDFDDLTKIKAYKYASYIDL